MRKIKQIIPAEKVNMGGHLIDQPLPSNVLESLDPFLLIHHWKNELPGNQKAQEVGVGPHPHRGFSPVTFIFKGEIEHRDSLGNRAIVEAGGTQWMFAGKGLTHSERFGNVLPQHGGELEFIQFWVNAPQKNKMDKPFYKPLSAEDTPTIEQENARIAVVSGQFENTEGAVPTNTPQLLLRLEIKKDGQVNIPVPAHFNTLVYTLDGALEINEQTINAKDMVVFEQSGDDLIIQAKEDTRFIVLAGEPIGEPVASYGPFVMTNQTEVMQAIRDAQMGKMGVLIEEFD